MGSLTYGQLSQSVWPCQRRSATSCEWSKALDDVRPAMREVMKGLVSFGQWRLRHAETILLGLWGKNNDNMWEESILLSKNRFLKAPKFWLKHVSSPHQTRNKPKSSKQKKRTFHSSTQLQGLLQLSAPDPMLRLVSGPKTFDVDLQSWNHLRSPEQGFVEF